MIDKLAKKLDLPEELIMDMILENHYLSKLYSKKKLKRINLKLEKGIAKKLLRVSKTLKVSLSAVISVIIKHTLSYYEEQKKQNNQI